MRMKNFCILIMPIAFCGCMVGPDYKNPNDTIGIDETSFPSFACEYREWKEAHPADNLPRGEWWRIFGDANLDKLMLDCRDKNPDLKSLFFRVEQARERACMTESRLYPWVSGNAEYLRFQQSENGALPVFGVNDDWLAGASLTWDADLFGRVRSMLRAEKANAESMLAEYENMLLALRTHVAQTYFSLKQFESERILLEKTVKIRREETDFVRTKVGMRVSNDIDLQRALQQEHRTRDELVVVKNKISLSRNLLANLLGTSSDKIKGSFGSLTSAVPDVPKSVPSDLLECRPDIAAAERRVCAANWKIGAAQAAFFPTITITGALGTESSAFSKLIEASTFSWGVSPQIYIPIFQAGRLVAQKRVALAKHKEMLEDYRSTVLRAIRETENALSNSECLKHRFCESSSAAAAAKKVELYASEQYEAGLIDYFAASESHRHALEAELACIRIRGEQFRNCVALIKSLGGNWRNPREYESDGKILSVAGDSVKIALP